MHPIQLTLTPEEILANWHTHGALWLMGDPEFIDKNWLKIIKAIRAITSENCDTLSARTLFADGAMMAECWDIRKAVAQSPHVPVDLLRILANDPVEEIVQLVAQNPQCPTDLLSHLSNHPSHNVRILVGNHPNTSQECKDKGWGYKPVSG